MGDAGGGFGVADDGAFGDLEDEAIEGEVGLTRGVGDVAGKGEIGEFGEGDVDGDREMGGDVFGSGEDGSEEFAGEEAVEAGAFGEGDELVGRDEASLGMLPAREGFEAAEEASTEFDERLEIGDDLVVFQGSAQIARVVGSHGRDDTTASRGLPNEISAAPAESQVAGGLRPTGGMLARRWTSTLWERSKQRWMGASMMVISSSWIIAGGGPLV